MINITYALVKLDTNEIIRKEVMPEPVPTKEGYKWLPVEEKLDGTSDNPVYGTPIIEILADKVVITTPVRSKTPQELEQEDGDRVRDILDTRLGRIIFRIVKEITILKGLSLSNAEILKLIQGMK